MALSKEKKLENYSDERIVDLVVHGDVDAFGEILSRYEAKLLRYVVYLIHDEDMAADAIQEAFIKSYENLRGFNPKYKFSSWIYRIAHNEAMNMIKKEAKIDKNAEVDDFVAEIGSESSIISDIDSSILKEDLLKCMSHLDTKYREVLMLRYLEGMSYEQIADIIRSPKATVGIRVKRAKERLKKICESKGVHYA